MRTRRFTQLGDAWPAGLGRRLGAMLYDGFLVTAIWIAVTVVHLMFFRYMLGQSPEDIGATACDVWSLRIMLVVFVSLFFVFSWTRGGMTLGMQAWRLRVQTREGYSLSVTQCLIRCGVAWLSLLTLGLGYLWVLFDPQRRSWPDIVSKTQTVVLPKG
ncbi:MULTISPECIES: RDD family protein [Halomonas]|uniref:RDD family protein n=1 Tax=Halomonas casei TaxID=2742613 RepID=A0ABR9F022_9GAMM|nr:MULTISPECIES: RDD family protein [Halomonas]MBE0399776.1 RDD family protein [Halomonas casei]PCC23662.1 RDD family protein [Halomonas sp. JB37]